MRAPDGDESRKNSRDSRGERDPERLGLLMAGGRRRRDDALLDRETARSAGIAPRLSRLSCSASALPRSACSLHSAKEHSATGTHASTRSLKRRRWFSPVSRCRSRSGCAVEYRRRRTAHDRRDRGRRDGSVARRYSACDRDCGHPRCGRDRRSDLGRLAGWLRARRDVNEVISTIMLNFVAVQALSWVVHGPLMEASRAYPTSSPIAPAAELGFYFAPSRLNLGMLLAVVLAVAVSSAAVSHRSRIRTARDGPQPPRGEVLWNPDSRADDLGDDAVRRARGTGRRGAGLRDLASTVRKVLARMGLRSDRGCPGRAAESNRDRRGRSFSARLTTARRRCSARRESRRCWCR